MSYESVKAWRAKNPERNRRNNQRYFRKHRVEKAAYDKARNARRKAAKQTVAEKVTANRKQTQFWWGGTT